MKNIILIIFLFSCICAFSQRSFQSEVYYKIDEWNGKTPIDSTIFIYNTSYGNISSFIPKEVTISNISDVVLQGDIVPYDRHIRFKYTNGIPYPNDTLHNTINALGLVSEVTRENQDWRRQYIYNADGLLKEEIYQKLINQVWTTESAIQYQYDDLGREISNEKHYDNGNSGYRLHDKEVRSYLDGTALVSELTVLKYSSIVDDMIYIRQSNFEYKNGNLDYIDYYVGSTLSFSSRFKYFIANNKVIEIREFNAKVTDDFLYPLSTISFAYNQDGNLINRTYEAIGGLEIIRNIYYVNPKYVSHVETFHFGAVGTGFVDRYGSRFHYNKRASITSNDPLFAFIYPNPTLDEIFIETNGELLSVNMYNLKGQLVLSQSSALIDVSHLRSGEYYVKGYTTTGNFTKSVIKI